MMRPGRGNHLCGRDGDRRGRDRDRGQFALSTSLAETAVAVSGGESGAGVTRASGNTSRPALTADWAVILCAVVSRSHQTESDGRWRSR